MVGTIGFPNVETRQHAAAAVPGTVRDNNHVVCVHIADCRQLSWECLFPGAEFKFPFLKR
jgi:hypothetical protein